MCTSRCGSLNGSPRRNRSLIKLKIAVFSPMPSASVRTAIKVNPGDLRSWRKANFRSFISLGAQCLNRIDKCGAAGRQQARKQSCGREKNGGTAKQCGVVRGNLKQLRRNQSPESECDDNSNGKADDDRLHPLANDQFKNICDLRDQG